MNICEIYTSIQGEGQFMGVPAEFIRTAGCSLKCGFCDTKHSWEKGKEMTVDGVLDSIGKSKLVVITGGEPLEQLVSVMELCRRLKEENKNRIILIETNGRIFSNSIRLWADEIVISPKAGIYHSDFLFSGSKVFFKWVVGNEKEADKVLKNMKNRGWKNFGLMPLAGTKGELNRQRRWLVPYCIKNRVYYIDRLQVSIWGKKKGV